MRQAIMTAPGKIEFRDLPAPEPSLGQVLVRMMRIGICGSDVHVYHGQHPFTTYPVVQGHEVSGCIVKVGAGATGFNAGDKVTVLPQMVCGQCSQCRTGKYHICDKLKVMGFQTDGMASDYFAVDNYNVLRLPDRMSYDHGAMVEPLAVGIHAIFRSGDPTGKKVLVLGAGPIGNLTAQAAKGLGAESVMITDLSDYRLKKAAECGIDFTFNSSTGDLVAEIKESFGSDRADIILECVGSPVTIKQAVRSARKGTDIIVVGVFKGQVKVDLGLLQDRELKLIGALMYQKNDFKIAVDLIESGQITLDPLISRHFEFSDYQEAYNFIEKNKETAMKVLIRGRTG